MDKYPIRLVSVPLRGVGCFNTMQRYNVAWNEFPSPCGVWVVSLLLPAAERALRVSVPLRAVGCFLPVSDQAGVQDRGFRPLAGCGLFLVFVAQAIGSTCFRPLAGCGLFRPLCSNSNRRSGFRPLAGCGLFRYGKVAALDCRCFRPLAGCGLFRRGKVVDPRSSEQFPSPCGVWVVSLISLMSLWAIKFPSPCGVWVVSPHAQVRRGDHRFRPLAGCGLFPSRCDYSGGCARFPSPCGVWVVS